ncbi:MAG: penicillin-insensitive murein endopeptidase [Alphaproteobacteria bacterium]|nr:penicillin-insensitive murein endopeptidase [Alphaproteobacteria bacterium]
MLAFAFLISHALASERPWSGAGAVTQLPDLPGLVDRWDAKRAWGTPLLVETLLSVSERLAWDHPDWDPITIGDLSRRGGGPLYGHKTHDLGIDADLGLFVRGGRQPDGFLDVRPADLDVAATWILVNALLDTGNVQFILLDQRHIDRLRAHALDDLGLDPIDVDAILVPPTTRLGWEQRGVVRHAPNHSSHLHVRITPPPPVSQLN